MQAGKIRRPDDAGVVHQLGDREGRLGVESTRGQVRKVRVADRFEQQLARHGDSPAEHEALRVEHGTTTFRGTGALVCRAARVHMG